MRFYVSMRGGPGVSFGGRRRRRGRSDGALIMLVVALVVLAVRCLLALARLLWLLPVWAHSRLRKQQRPTPATTPSTARLADPDYRRKVEAIAADLRHMSSAQIEQARPILLAQLTEAQQEDLNVVLRRHLSTTTREGRA